MTAMTHWAAGLIGAPWRAGASGPGAFDCWGLVRFVFEHRHGIVVPPVVLAVLGGTVVDNVAAIKHAARTSGWHAVEGPPQADDVVLMHGIKGRHVGLMVQANGQLGVLHANGYQSPAGPVGCVVFEPLAGASAGGYGDFEFWRRTRG
jgi:cell wall-associated NlpC family hydrolase